jgi:hypothetical protein
MMGARSCNPRSDATLYCLGRQFVSTRAWHHTTIAAKLYAAPLCCLQCRLGSLGNPLRLVLCDHGHDPDRQPIGVRHVGGNEINAGLLETKQEVSVAGQPIQFCDHQPGAVQTVILGVDGISDCQMRRPYLSSEDREECWPEQNESLRD